MAFCSVEQIKRKCKGKRKVKKVETPEWGKGSYIFVRKLSAKEGSKIRKLIPDKGTDDEKELAGIVGWCILCACDEKGKFMFDESSKEFLGDADLSVITRIANDAMRVNGLLEDSAGN